MKQIPIEVRFWKYVQKGDTEDCWIWTGQVGMDGYGRTSIQLTNYRAHRMSWMLHNGHIPPGMNVLHRCDNPLCVNPSHLFLGTQRDNMRDRFGKGRSLVNVDKRDVRSKLSSETAVEIRALAASGEMNRRQLADKYGVSKPTITAILQNRTYVGAGEPDYINPRRRRRVTCIADLGETAMRVWVMIADSQKNHQYTPSYKELSDVIGINQPGITNTIHQLERVGVLKKPRYGKRSVTILIFPPEDLFRRYGVQNPPEAMR